MSGTIPLSLTQQLDQYGKPLNGGVLHFIQAGTTSTPQNAFQDSALTIPWPNPLTLDSAGRVPQLFFADGQIKVRITNAAGITQVVADNIPVLGLSSGGGGPSVDPTTVIQTGQVVLWYGTGVRGGFVRANGRTVGSATSGATERANADTQALFEFLYTTDLNLAVSGGRGVSAAADWAANKNIALPDFRGRSPYGLDDMGATAAGRLTALYFGTAATVLGAVGGEEKRVLDITQIPSHNHGGATGVMSANASHTHSSNANTGSSTTGGGAFTIGGSSAATINPTNIDHTHSISSQGGGLPHATVSPGITVTFYLKL